jgi:hypothetical protein
MTCVEPCICAINGEQNGTLVVGDGLTAFTPARSEMAEGFVVKSVKPYPKKAQWQTP